MRQHRYAEMLKAHEQKIAQVIHPEQVDRLRQIARQQRGPFAFTRQELIASPLQLTPEQRTRINDVIELNGPHRANRRRMVRMALSAHPACMGQMAHATVTMGRAVGLPPSVNSVVAVAKRARRPRLEDDNAADQFADAYDPAAFCSSPRILRITIQTRPILHLSLTAA